MAREQRNVTVALSPLDVEPCSDSPVNLSLGSADTEQACDVTDPLVNLPTRGFDVGLVLAGADSLLSSAFVR